MLKPASLHELEVPVDRLLVLGVLRGDDGVAARLPGELLGVLHGLLAVEPRRDPRHRRLDDVRAVGEQAPGERPALDEPVPRRVRRADVHDALPGQRVGVREGDAADVGEGADLLPRLHRVGERLLAPAAEQLRRADALPVEELDADAPAVELEALVEVVGVGEDGVLERLGRLAHALAAEVREDLRRRRPLELADGDDDLLGRDAGARLPAVVAGEGDARRRVRVAGHLLPPGRRSRRPPGARPAGPAPGPAGPGRWRRAGPGRWRRAARARSTGPGRAGRPATRPRPPRRGSPGRRRRRSGGTPTRRR